MVAEPPVGGLEDFLREDEQHHVVPDATRGQRAEGENPGQNTWRQWSDEEWRRWNEGRRGWSGWEWIPQQSAAAATAAEERSSPGRSPNGVGPSGGVSSEATGNADRSRASGHGSMADPWSNWSRWQNYDGWWSQEDWDRWNWQRGTKHGSSKGDYADPPGWPGWAHFRHWKRALVRWDSNTDVPVWRRAEKVLRQFTWDFQVHFDHLREDQLNGPDYLNQIVAILDVLAGERVSSEKRRTIRAALYEGGRKSEESLAQYALRREAQFVSADPFLNIPDELKAFLLEEQANLNKQNLQNLRTITGGICDYSSVKKALQILDTQEEPISKKTSGQYFQSEPPDQPSEGSSDEESDVEEIFLAIEQQELSEDQALSFISGWDKDKGKKKRTWSENKAMKLARRKDRRHFDLPEGRPSRPPNRRKMSVEELKKITSCRRCGKVGHWEEDCSEPKNQNKPKGNLSGFVFLGNQESRSSSSLSSFLAENINFLISLAEWDQCEASQNYLTIPEGHAIIDPGASQDLIGLPAYERLCAKLKENNLKTIKLNTTPSPASGVGGNATPLFEALCPCVLAKQPGVIRITVLKEDIPHLLSIGLLEHSGAVIDTADNLIRFKRFDKQDQMLRLDSGHRILNIADWDGSDFPVPDILSEKYGVVPGDFNIRPTRADYRQAAGGPTAANSRISRMTSGQSLKSLTAFDTKDRQLEFEEISLGVSEGWTHDFLGNAVLVSRDVHVFRTPNTHESSFNNNFVYRDTWVLFEDRFELLESNCDWRLQNDPHELLPNGPFSVSVSVFHGKKSEHDQCQPCDNLAHQPPAISQGFENSRSCSNSESCPSQHAGASFESPPNAQRARSRSLGDTLGQPDSQAAVGECGQVFTAAATTSGCFDAKHSAGDLCSSRAVHCDRRKPIWELEEVPAMSSEAQLCPLVGDQSTGGKDQEDSDHLYPSGDVGVASREQEVEQGKGCSCRSSAGSIIDNSGIERGDGPSNTTSCRDAVNVVVSGHGSPSAESTGFARDPPDEHDDADAGQRHDAHEQPGEHVVADAHGSSTAAAAPVHGGLHGP